MSTVVRASKTISLPKARKSPTLDSVLTQVDTIQRLADKSGEFLLDFPAYQIDYDKKFSLKTKHITLFFINLERENLLTVTGNKTCVKVL